MTTTQTSRSWVLPAAIALLMVVVFAVLLAVSPTVRHYWPLLILAAAAAALPFLLFDSGRRNDAVRRSGSQLPISRPSAGDAGPAPAAAPALRASGFTTPKASATGGENEDAYGIDVETGYLAVADGASSSFQAAEWSALLCRTFLDQKPLAALTSPAWIATATAAFRESAQHGSDWWSTEAAERGAHAAFVGLAIIRLDDRLSWRAAAVGDCVLVHLRQAPAGQPPIVTAFPITHSAAFPANPALLSSAADGQPPVSFIEGSAEIGDVYLLMTDELARWALRRHEAGDPAWALLATGSDADLAAAVAAARGNQAVADDDMTVVRCEVVAAD